MTWLRPEISRLPPFSSDFARGLLKLDAMESPHTLPASLKDELHRRLSTLELNRYPIELPLLLKERLLEKLQLPAGYSVMVGNGSDDLIQVIAAAACGDHSTMLVPTPTFFMYARVAAILRLKYAEVSLRSDFHLDVPLMLKAIGELRPSIVFLAYPNNPTGTLWPTETLRTIVKACTGTCVTIDEAYYYFSGRSWLDELQACNDETSNVVILRSLSKVGFAGARIGYLIGPTHIVQELEKIRQPYSVSGLNATCGIFALEHEEFLRNQAQQIVADRVSLQQELERVDGVVVYPSQANMLLIRVPSATRVFVRMREQGVLVKNVGAMHPSLKDCLRITVGTSSDNARLLDALRLSL